MLVHVNSPKILVQFAKAKEGTDTSIPGTESSACAAIQGAELLSCIFTAEGDFRGSLKAYQKANDMDNSVRILVEHLRDIESAVDIVRKTRSPDSSKTIARFFQSMKGTSCEGYPEMEVHEF
jgi:WD repeat-containing protein 19